MILLKPIQNKVNSLWMLRFGIGAKGPLLLPDKSDIVWFRTKKSAESFAKQFQIDGWDAALPPDAQAIADNRPLPTRKKNKPIII